MIVSIFVSSGRGTSLLRIEPPMLRSNFFRVKCESNLCDPKKNGGTKRTRLGRRVVRKGGILKLSGTFWVEFTVEELVYEGLVRGERQMLEIISLYERK